MAALIKPGDRVRVIFGFREVEGIVDRDDGIEPHSKYTVMLDLDGVGIDFDDPFRAIYAVDQVERIDAA